MTFDCHLCSRTFKTQGWLQRHINADHPTLDDSSDIDNSSHVEHDSSSSISVFSMPCYHTNLQENNIHSNSNMNTSSSSQSPTCNSSTSIHSHDSYIDTQAMDIDLLPPQSEDVNEDASISIRSRELRELHCTSLRY